jgi:hypothetical protein
MVLGRLSDFTYTRGAENGQELGRTIISDYDNTQVGIISLATQPEFSRTNLLESCFPSAMLA